MWVCVRSWNPEEPAVLPPFDELKNPFDCFLHSIMEPSKSLWHPMLTQCMRKDLGLAIDRYLAELSSHFGWASNSRISYAMISIPNLSSFRRLFWVHSNLCCMKVLCYLGHTFSIAIPCIFDPESQPGFFWWSYCRP